MDDSFDLEVKMSNAPRNNQANEQRSGPKNNKQNRQDSPQKTCNNCGKPGHYANECRSKKQNKQNGQDSSQKSCDNCGRPGHYANECRSNQNKPKKTCNNCGKPGHLANDCYSKQGNDGVNGNAKQNNDRRNSNVSNVSNNSRNSNNSNSNSRVDPNNTSPKDSCYMHPTSKHSNEDCNNSSNKWFSSRQPKQPKQNKNDNQQQKPQHNRHGNFRGNNDGPISGAAYNYCERCNEVGHLAVTCSSHAIETRKVFTCSQCKNPGHTHTECNHPAFCRNCLGSNHTHATEDCNQKPCDFARFTRCSKDYIYRTVEAGPSAFQPASITMVDAYPRAPQFQQQVQAQPQPQYQAQAQPTTTANPKPQTFFTAPTPPRRNSTKTPAYFFGGQWYEVPNTDIPIHQLVASLAAEQAAKHARQVKAKCQRAHQQYALHLLNDEIEQGAAFFGRVDPRDPGIQLPANRSPTPELERITQSWIAQGSFATAATMIRAGANFFRDPRALDGISRGEAPVCCCCSRPGMVLDATFCEIKPGTVDVMAVEDYDVWGVSVAFACGCCRKDGFSWGPRGEAFMDMSA